MLLAMRVLNVVIRYIICINIYVKCMKMKWLTPDGLDKWNEILIQIVPWLDLFMCINCPTKKSQHHQMDFGLCID